MFCPVFQCPELNKRGIKKILQTMTLPLALCLLAVINEQEKPTVSTQKILFGILLNQIKIRCYLLFSVNSIKFMKIAQFFQKLIMPDNCWFIVHGLFCLKRDSLQKKWANFAWFFIRKKCLSFPSKFLFCRKPEDFQL